MDSITDSGDGEGNGFTFKSYDAYDSSALFIGALTLTIIRKAGRFSLRERLNVI
jgi:uncharacterized membrane protein YphA (DoxX/SURF4 family)